MAKFSKDEVQAIINSTPIYFSKKRITDFYYTTGIGYHISGGTRILLYAVYRDPLGLHLVACKRNKIITDTKEL